jgi:hypothetical protein
MKASLNVTAYIEKPDFWITNNKGGRKHTWDTLKESWNMSSSSMLPVDKSRLLIGQNVFDSSGTWPIIALDSSAAGDVHGWASETNEFFFLINIYIVLRNKESDLSSNLNKKQ